MDVDGKGGRGAVLVGVWMPCAAPSDRWEIMPACCTCGAVWWWVRDGVRPWLTGNRRIPGKTGRPLATRPH